MSDRSTAEPTHELSRLAFLQDQLKALEHGAPLGPGAAMVSAGVQRRLAGRALTEQIKDRREQEAQRGLQRLQERVAELAASAEQHRRRRAVQRARQPVEQRPSPPGPPELPTLWSPQPVLGFRVWNVADRLYGARAAWPTPEFTARCLRHPSGSFDDTVPHTSGCRRPPCGIYAVKHIERLVDEVGLPSRGNRWVYGLVELTGKVVEHDHGYRAKHARCVAAAVVSGGHLIRIEGETLAALFRNPEVSLPRIVAWPRTTGVIEDLITYLEEARLLHEATGSLPPQA
jgi:hypothetical protein